MKSRGPAGMIFATLLAFFGHGAAAQGRPVAESHAPRAWVAYAQTVSQRFQQALAGDSEPAQRFHAFLDAHGDAAGDAHAAAPVPPTLRVKAWFDGAGQVTQVEFTPLGDAAAEADLRTVLTQQHMDAAPPRGMKQPVVIRIGLSEAQE